MRSGLGGVGGEGGREESEWEKGGNWLALPADMNGDVKEEEREGGEG